MTGLDTGILVTFAILWAAIVPTPGANSLMVTHIALTRAWPHVLAAIAGNMVGIAALGLAALLGMALLLETFPWLRLAIRILGAAYLIYFGARLLLRHRRAATASASEDGPEHRSSLWQSFMTGLATSLSNAQAVVFVASIFAVAGVLKASLTTGLACVGTMIVLNASYLALLGWLFQLPTPRTLYLRFRRGIECAIGGLFTVLGLRMLLRQFS